ncbi:MAG: hypothetical protein AB4352_19685 [Hormoscilla sp.]
MIEYKWLKEIKKEFYLVIAGGMLASALGGATLATILHKDPPTREPAVSIRRPTESRPEPVPEAFAEEPATPKSEKLELGRKPIDLDDEVEPGSEFDSFRQELRQAVTERNAFFIRSILPAEGISLGFSRPIGIDELGLENPDGRFWSLLEKAIANSCAAEASDNYPPVDRGTTVWICSNVTKEFYRQYPAPSSASGLDWELNHAIVVGRNVNVRSQPSLNSEVISNLSNEVVKLDRETAEKQWQEQVEKGQEVDPIYGWTPVILPNEEKGYVYNRYVYGPLENRAVFGKVAGEWQLLSMPGGD